MKAIKTIQLIVGVALLSIVPLAHAEDAAKDAKSARPNRDEAREKFKSLTPEEREAKMKEWREKNPNAAGAPDMEKRREEMKKMAKDLGLSQEDLKNLSPEERRDKIKEAGEKKLAELNKKKADGTITAEEKETLTRLETRKKMMQEHGGSAERGPRAHKPGEGKPPGDKPAGDKK